MAILALAQDDALQALPLFLGRDLARHSRVIHGRHVNQETSGQGDVAGDARALLADRFLGNLNQNLLAFFQQIADQGNRCRLTAAESGFYPLLLRRGGRDHGARNQGDSRSLWCPLGVSGGRGRANFGAGIHGAVPARFGVEHSFRFGLGFFEFRVFAILFRGAAPSAGSFAGLRSSFQVNLRNGVPSVRHQVGAIGSLGFFLEFFVALVRRRLVVERCQLPLLRWSLLPWSRERQMRESVPRSGAGELKR